MLLQTREPERLGYPIDDMSFALMPGEKHVFKSITLKCAPFEQETKDGRLIRSGAFAKTIREQVPKRAVKLQDSHDWSCAATLGSITKAEETKTHLIGTFALSSDQPTQNIATKAHEGHITQTSVGIGIVERVVQERKGKFPLFAVTVARWIEQSLCMEASFADTGVISVHSVTPFQALPLTALDHAWNAQGAEARVRGWATQRNDELNFPRYQQAFLWWDATRPDLIGSYQLPVADIVNGQLQAVPRGIIAAAQAVNANDHGLPEQDLAALRQNLDRYFAAIRQNLGVMIMAPWDAGAETTRASMAETQTKDLTQDQEADTVPTDSAAPPRARTGDDTKRRALALRLRQQAQEG